MSRVQWPQLGPRYRYGSSDVERRLPEGAKRRLRSEFERDVDRIIHSESWRRIGSVTQFQRADGRTRRTRSLHSQEVVTVAVALAKALGVDPAIVTAACLLHDIGHPPFGHEGEFVLFDIAYGHGLTDGFEANAQNLRLVCDLDSQIVDEHSQSWGLNLTRAVLDALIKYPWVAFGGYKFGAYHCDEKLMAWIRQHAPKDDSCRLSVEAQLMDIADDIAYATSDIEEAVLDGEFDIRVLFERDHYESAEERICRMEIPGLGPQEVAMARSHVQSFIHNQMFPRHFFQSPILQHQFHDRQLLKSTLKKIRGDLIDHWVGAIRAATKEVNGGPIGRYYGNVIVPPYVTAQIEFLKTIFARQVVFGEKLTLRRLPYTQMYGALTQQLIEYGRRPEFAMGYVTPLVEDMGNGLHTTAWLRALTLASDDPYDRTYVRAMIDAAACLTDRNVSALCEKLKIAKPRVEMGADGPVVVSIESTMRRETGPGGPRLRINATTHRKPPMYRGHAPRGY